MSDFPLRGDGIEIRENTKESDEDRRKYNVHIDPDLFVHLMQGTKWGTNTDTGRRVRGYVATSEGYEEAAGDDKCPSG